MAKLMDIIIADTWELSRWEHTYLIDVKILRNNEHNGSPTQTEHKLVDNEPMLVRTYICICVHILKFLFEYMHVCMYVYNTYDSATIFLFDMAQIPFSPNPAFAIYYFDWRWTII